MGWVATTMNTSEIKQLQIITPNCISLLTMTYVPTSRRPCLGAFGRLTSQPCVIPSILASIRPSDCASGRQSMHFLNLLENHAATSPTRICASFPDSGFTQPQQPRCPQEPQTSKALELEYYIGKAVGSFYEALRTHTIVLNIMMLTLRLLLPTR